MTSVVQDAAGPPTVVGDGKALCAWLDRARAAGPVWHDQATDAYHVLQHEEVIRVLSEPQTFSSDFSAFAPPPDPGVPNFTEASLSVTDPPMHGKLRKMVSQAFTPRMVAGLQPRITALAGDLLDALDGRTDIELVKDLAAPLPVVVIAELLGIPTADWAMFRRWAECLLPEAADVVAGQFDDSEQSGARAAGLNEMADYMLGHVHDRRADPRDDLVTRLTQAAADGETLTDKQVVNFSVFLLLAGHLTTTLTLSSALLCFDEHPGVLGRLREDRSLIPGALEEVLRLRPPACFLYRLTKQEAKIGDVLVPAGKIVVNWILSANRDERRFAAPERFDPLRSPNPHLTFSHGIHYCLGVPLARMEFVTLVNAMLDRYSDIGVGTPVFHQRPDIFGVTGLPLTVRPA
ncbi:cytochrome P450 [Amycolatopsis kentuckyensis]|uniref:cytochrome P450 n=1 Tax=Amycolatopsis kentuckyensis TaxID=218823 RepID=UPI000A367F0C|nr:cytochrome P450 [Amycolatopsis kentuckyensis]